jgi:hypothetical protein
MRRRDFIAGALAGSVSSRGIAQQPPRIVILHSGFPTRTPIHEFYEALRLLGYENGQTADIELLEGKGDPQRLKTLVKGLRNSSPSVIVGLTSPAVLALRDAQVSAPVVFAFVADPVGLGVVNSLARPGITRDSLLVKLVWVVSDWSFSETPYPSSSALRCCGASSSLRTCLSQRASAGRVQNLALT